MRLAQESLFPENARAWLIFHQTATRFLADVSAGGCALERLTADVGQEEFSDLIERLALLYDVLCPPPAPKS